MNYINKGNLIGLLIGFMVAPYIHSYFNPTSTVEDMMNRSSLINLSENSNHSPIQTPYQ